MPCMEDLETPYCFGGRMKVLRSRCIANFVFGSSHPCTAQQNTTATTTVESENCHNGEAQRSSAPKRRRK